MGVFRFKRFEVNNEQSAMKVNTDGVILGAAMTVRETDRNVLDVGTGTGTIALMAAQRLSAMSGQGNGRNPEDNEDVGKALPVENGLGGSFSVTAVEIDEASADEAGKNFAASPWSGSMRLHHTSLQEFRADTGTYDLVCSNPPYFEEALKAPDERRRNARHNDSLSYRELIEFAASKLSEHGRLSMILPSGQENDVLRYARMNGLHPYRTLYIRTVPRKPISRVVIELSAERRPEPIKETLSIHNADGEYSDEYRSLMSDFLVIFH